MSSYGLTDLAERVRRARRVYIIGNGGSYANAMHICNDLLARGIRAYTLDPATAMAIGNDMGFEFVFSHWIAVVGEPGDMLLALSGSGTSPNILLACKVAEGKDMDVVKVFGAQVGLNMQQAEEAQLQMGHELWKRLSS